MSEASIPETYEGLCAFYLPRKIRNDTECARATSICDWIVTRAENDDQLDYLDLISDQIEAYERAKEPDEKSSPLELLNFIVKEHNMTVRELGGVLGVDHSIAARILKGERSITVKHAKTLGDRFKLHPVAFLDL